MIWKYFYDIGSGAEHGTLYQLKNLLNRSEVGKVPKNKFNSCDDFLQIVITGHILSATCEILGMSGIDDQPSLAAMGVDSPEVLWSLTDDERKAFLTKISTSIVQKFINFSFNTAPNNAHTDEVHRYACLFLSIGCFYLHTKML